MKIYGFAFLIICSFKAYSFDKECALVFAFDSVSRQPDFMPFEKVLEYIHSLNLSSRVKYKKWILSRARPLNIPRVPEKIYRDKWQGWGHYLGTGRIANKNKVFRPFEEALEYIHSLNLSSEEKYFKWSKSGERPPDIPSNPKKIYKDQWQGWGRYLGTGRVASKDKVFRPFAEALSYMHSLEFSSRTEFRKWNASGRRPLDIPSHPNEVYKDKWRGWRHYLGLEDPSPGIYMNGKKQWSFKKSKKYAKSLNFENIKEFIEWLKSDSRPLQFPANPHEVYSEWISAADFLDLYWPYQKSKVYVQGLFLQSKEQFIKWALSDERPKDFPFNPQKIYKDQWEGWPKFLVADNF